MDLLLTIAIWFIAMLSEKRNTTQLSLWISKLAKRIYDIPEFDYYAIADGIVAILNKARKGIQSFIDKKISNPEPHNNLCFPVCCYDYNNTYLYFPFWGNSI